MYLLENGFEAMLFVNREAGADVLQQLFGMCEGVGECGWVGLLSINVCEHVCTQVMTHIHTFLHTYTHNPMHTRTPYHPPRCIEFGWVGGGGR